MARHLTVFARRPSQVWVGARHGRAQPWEMPTGVVAERGAVVMDLDAYVAIHRPEWYRLRHLVDKADRPRRMPKEELDELVELYQRVASHLSVIKGRTHDQAMVDDLSSLVIRARAAVAGG